MTISPFYLSIITLVRHVSLTVVKTELILLFTVPEKIHFRTTIKDSKLKFEVEAVC